MRLLLSLLIAFSPMTMAAELILKGPVELLAVTPAQAIADNKVTLPAGEHQLLVRYQDVVVSRSNNDSDIDVRSEPQVLRLTVGADDKLVLSAPSLNGQKEMESFAKKPSFTLTGNSSQPVQDEVKLKGFLIGVDYDDVLANEEKFNFDILDNVVASAKVMDIRDIANETAAQVQEVETTSSLAENEVILDIRSPDEHEEKPFTPEGMTVLHLPFYKLATQFGDLDQSKTYLLYCERGVMSKLQALYLKEQGFNNIKVYRLN